MTVLNSGCVSPHVAMAQRDHLHLDWCEPYPALTRARAVAWTCACRATVYELHTGAGRGFIRRTVQLDGRPQIHHTPPWPAAEALVIWTALLSGHAR
ncbi:hypothetical protein [Planomonospora venezuelensis]|uniref:Uncharacterized protein n=1 Tax=Planomonospora venezuelensis TaxID=1999 RepID=A0A841DG89_PLAVE|nr:hypothetical protein [Planomonospora venezuelensis]MBB5967318.1 hypothetical protein [Planomonospora venezuelensis]GIN04708.1 hypothetical protein Pve01_63660 [Planomonospora venezuelensis]